MYAVRDTETRGPGTDRRRMARVWFRATDVEPPRSVDVREAVKKRLVALPRCDGADDENAERPLGGPVSHHLGRRWVTTEPVDTGAGDYGWRRVNQSTYRLAGGLAVEYVGVTACEEALFKRAVNPASEGGPGFGRPQVVDDGDGRLWESPDDADERGVTEFVHKEDIDVDGRESSVDTRVKRVREGAAWRALGERDSDYDVALVTQAVGHPAVVEVAPGALVERSVDDYADPHGS
jgi:hypothetical protein